MDREEPAPRLEAWLGEHFDNRDAAELLLALLFTLPASRRTLGTASTGEDLAWHSRERMYQGSA